VDYIRQELLRQRFALAALLGGEGPRPGQETEPVESRARNTETLMPLERFSAAEMEAAGRDVVVEPAEDRNRADMTTERSSGSAAGRFRPLIRNGGDGSPGGDTAGAALTEGVTGAADAWNGASFAEGGFQRSGGWGVGGGISLDVGEVSRAVQRDARRYDGGFFMF